MKENYRSYYASSVSCMCCVYTYIEDVKFELIKNARSLWKTRRENNDSGKILLK